MRFSVLCVMGGVIGLSGCASLNNPVSFTDLQSSQQQYVVDQTAPDNYPGFMAAEGNDFSCRYGIHHESKEEFSPPKAQIFAALLSQALPQITSHKVVLQQFDVYYNHRLRSLGMLGSGGLGGVIGASIGQANEEAARQNMGVVVFDKLLIDTNPLVDRHPDQNQVGCNNAHEGEYYPSEISGGFDVVVSWLKFSVDDKPYYFRTFYQFQPANKADMIAGINEAIRMSVQGISQKIEL